jgi:hypothetical protein
MAPISGKIPSSYVHIRTDTTYKVRAPEKFEPLTEKYVMDETGLNREMTHT